MAAGVDHAQGEVVAVMDGDLQDEPEFLAALYDAWRRGADVALATGTQPLFPAAYAGVAGGGPKPVVPFAFSNPIFADADGGGYDKFPFGASGGSAPPPPKSSKWSTLAPDERVRRLLDEARSEGGH